MTPREAAVLDAVVRWEIDRRSITAAEALSWFGWRWGGEFCNRVRAEYRRRAEAEGK